MPASAQCLSPELLTKHSSRRAVHVATWKGWANHQWAITAAHCVDEKSLVTLQTRRVAPAGAKQRGEKPTRLCTRYAGRGGGGYACAREAGALRVLLHPSADVALVELDALQQGSGLGVCTWLTGGQELLVRTYPGSRAGDPAALRGGLGCFLGNPAFTYSYTWRDPDIGREAGLKGKGDIVAVFGPGCAGMSGSAATLHAGGEFGQQPGVLR